MAWYLRRPAEDVYTQTWFGSHNLPQDAGLGPQEGLQAEAVSGVVNKYRHQHAGCRWLQLIEGGRVDELLSSSACGCVGLQCAGPSAAAACASAAGA